MKKKEGAKSHSKKKKIVKKIIPKKKKVKTIDLNKEIIRTISPNKENIKITGPKKLGKLPLILLVSFVLTFFAILLLYRAGKLSFSIWYSAILVGINLGVIISSAVLFLLNYSHKKQDEEEKERHSAVRMIKQQVNLRRNKYETNLDTLYHLLEKKGKLSLKAVADGFGIKESQAEIWAKILEEEGLAKLNYTVSKGAEVCRK